LYHITIQLNSDVKITNTIVEQNSNGGKKAWSVGRERGERKTEKGEGRRENEKEVRKRAVKRI